MYCEADEASPHLGVWQLETRAKLRCSLGSALGDALSQESAEPLAKKLQCLFPSAVSLSCQLYVTTKDLLSFSNLLCGAECLQKQQLSYTDDVSTRCIQLSAPAYSSLAGSDSNRGSEPANSGSTSDDNSVPHDASLSRGKHVVYRLADALDLGMLGFPGVSPGLNSAPQEVGQPQLQDDGSVWISDQEGMFWELALGQPGRTPGEQRSPALGGSPVPGACVLAAPLLMDADEAVLEELGQAADLGGLPGLLDHLQLCSEWLPCVGALTLKLEGPADAAALHRSAVNLVLLALAASPHALRGGLPAIHRAGLRLGVIGPHDRYSYVPGQGLLPERIEHALTTPHLQYSSTEDESSPRMYGGSGQPAGVHTTSCRQGDPQDRRGPRRSGETDSDDEHGQGLLPVPLQALASAAGEAVEAEPSGSRSRGQGAGRRQRSQGRADSHAGVAWGSSEREGGGAERGDDISLPGSLTWESDGELEARAAQAPGRGLVAAPPLGSGDKGPLASETGGRDVPAGEPRLPQQGEHVPAPQQQPTGSSSMVDTPALQGEVDRGGSTTQEEKEAAAAAGTAAASMPIGSFQGMPLAQLEEAVQAGGFSRDWIFRYASPALEKLFVEWLPEQAWMLERIIGVFAYVNMMYRIACTYPFEWLDREPGRLLLYAIPGIVTLVHEANYFAGRGPIWNEEWYAILFVLVWRLYHTPGMFKYALERAARDGRWDVVHRALFDTVLAPIGGALTCKRLRMCKWMMLAPMGWATWLSMVPFVMSTLPAPAGLPSWLYAAILVAGVLVPSIAAMGMCTYLELRARKNFELQVYTAIQDRRDAGQAVAAHGTDASAAADDNGRSDVRALGTSAASARAAA